MPGPERPSHRSAAFREVLWPKIAPKHDAAVDAARDTLRHLILTDPYDEVGAAQLRATTWKVLLGGLDYSAKSYFDLVSRGQSPQYDKIRNDTFRTLATDEAFKSRVSEDMLVRLLEAFAWRANDAAQDQTGTISHDLRVYVQGMNVLAAPFLYTMPSELEAFYAFSRFIEVQCPLYVQPTLEGVHAGLRILDECLRVLDRELFDYLKGKDLAAEIYAFPSVMTFCACTPPLDQVLQLWDYLIAFGVGLNILCVIAQLYVMRDEILVHPSPMKLFRTLPPLDARQVIVLTNFFIHELPPHLYDRVVRHPFEAVVD